MKKFYIASNGKLSVATVSGGFTIKNKKFITVDVDDKDYALHIDDYKQLENTKNNLNIVQWYNFKDIAILLAIKERIVSKNV